MAIEWHKLALPKGKTRKQLKARQLREKRLSIKAIRAYVFEREGHRCRYCHRPAESMHEIVPRSLGGRVSPENSIALCGSGTTGCHGLAQGHRLLIVARTMRGAEGPLSFQPVRL